MQKIFGAESHFKFNCTSQVQRVGNEKYVTLGQKEDGNVHLVQFYASSQGTYFKTSSLKDFGYWLD